MRPIHLKRKLKGLCFRCGATAKVRRTRCDACAAKHNSQVKRVGEDRRKAGRCAKCGRGTCRDGQTSCAGCIKRGSEIHRQRQEKRRQKALEKLGGVCVRCGDTRFVVLEIDHVTPGSGQHSTAAINAILKGVREGYQVLCANCHRIKTSEDRGTR